MKYTECSACKAQITNNNFKRHTESCNGKQSWFVRCGKSLKENKPKELKIISSEKRFESTDWKAVQEFYDSNHTYMETCSKFRLGTSFLSLAVKRGVFKTRLGRETYHLKGHKPHLHTPESKAKISNSMRKAVLEGRQQTNKPYGKHLRIIRHVSWLGNEEILHGGWEHKLALFLDEHRVSWSKPRTSFTYVWRGAEHEYFPDFYLSEQNCYIEVKGYKTERDQAKWDQFPETLLILDKTHIKDISGLFRYYNITFPNDLSIKENL